MQNITECNYFDIPNLDPSDRNSTESSEKTLSLLHVILRSINNFQNFDTLEEFLTDLSFSFDIVCVSETRLKGEPLINISIPNFKFVHADSTTKAGGVAIYISSKFDFELDRELEMHIKDCEDLWINLTQKEKPSKKLTIGAIYRHPNPSSNSIETFSEALSNSIHKINNRKCTFYVLGDMNIDISANKRTSAATMYIDHLTSCGSVPIITKPTRVTEKTLTTIDHIITNDAAHVIQPGVIRCDKSLSDHYVIFCKVIGYNSAPTQETNYVIRDTSNFDAELYCDELSSAITTFLSNVNELTEANFDKNFNAFTSLIQKVIDKHAPLKQLSRKQKKLKIKPWITKDVYAKICTKRRMHKSHYINGNEAMKHEHKIFSNKVTKLKATAKKKLLRRRT